MRIVREQWITFIVSTVGGCLAIWLMKKSFDIATVATSIACFLIIFAFLRFGIYRWAMRDAKDRIDCELDKRAEEMIKEEIRKLSQVVWDEFKEHYKYKDNCFPGAEGSALFTIVGPRGVFDYRHPRLVEPKCSNEEAPCHNHRLHIRQKATMLYQVVVPDTGLWCPRCEKVITVQDPDIFRRQAEEEFVRDANLLLKKHFEKTDKDFST